VSLNGADSKGVQKISIREEIKKIEICICEIRGKLGKWSFKPCLIGPMHLPRCAWTCDLQIIQFGHLSDRFVRLVAYEGG
jgi:hypothetical protein